MNSNISVVNTEIVRAAVKMAVNERTGGYVCFTNVHTVVEATRNETLQRTLNEALIAAPDSKPLSVVARWWGAEQMEQVPGPDFVPYLIESEPELNHYFMGSTETTLNQLVVNLRSRFPQMKVAGYYSPPFGPMEGAINEEILRRLQESDADVVWVGLGAPKQEIWMLENWEALSPRVLLGVGAAFDFHAGNLKRAPDWMRRSGLEWLHRLASEPRRLWRRYLFTNTAFIAYVLKESVVRYEKH